MTGTLSADDADDAAIEAEGRHRRALAVLGWDQQRVDDVLPDKALNHHDPAWRAFATASLLLRAAGAEARDAERPVAYQVTNDLFGTDSALMDQARLVAAPLGAEEENLHERASWESQRLVMLLQHLDVGPDADPYLAGALAAALAATDLLFGPIRMLTTLEDQIPGLAAQNTAAYLDKAEQRLRLALAAVDIARSKLGT